MSRLLKPWVLWVLILVNGIGTLYGFWWYKGQLLDSPWYYWPLIPDSPQASADFTLLLLFLALGRWWNGLGILASFQMIKYGLWAVLINLQGAWLLGEFSPENWMLTFSHLGMAVEGLIILGLLRITPRSWLLLVLWLAFNDFADYVWGIHPFLFHSAQYPVAWQGAVTLTVGLSALAFWIMWKGRQEQDWKVHSLLRDQTQSP